MRNKYSELFDDEDKSKVSSQQKYQSSQALNLTNSFYTNKSSNYDSLIDSDNSFKTNKKSKKINKMSLFQNTFKKSEMSSQMNSHSSFIKNRSNNQELNIRDFHLIESNNMKTLPEDGNVTAHQKHKNESIGTFMAKQTNIKKKYLNEDDNDNLNDMKSNKDSKKKDRLKSVSKSSKTNKKSKSKSKSFSSSSSGSINLSGNLPKKMLENKSNDQSSNNSSDKDSEESKNSYSIGSKINEEIYPGEECKIPIREEMLLNKNINLSKIENKSLNNLNENKNNFENSKVRILLDYSVNLSNANDFEKSNEKSEKQKKSDTKIDKKKLI